MVARKAKGNEPRTLTKPFVIVFGRPDDEILQDYIRCITARQEQPVLFRQGRELSIIRRDSNNVAYLQLLTKEGAMYLMAQCANACVMEDDVRKNVPVPARIASYLLECEYPFPPIAGVSRVPVFRRDGTFVLQPGYDASTQIFYDPPCDFSIPPIPDDPPQAFAQEAARTISDLLCDFPFVTESDRANALALGLTLFVRQAIDGLVPMAVIDAVSQQGTGKGLLADVLHLIATGGKVPINPMPKDDTELRKAITARAIGGDTVIAFDNVRGVINSEALEAALTSENWNDRVMGLSKMVNARLCCTWMMTGNGVQLGHDMISRAYFVRLDAGQAHAYERDNFTHPDRDNSDKLKAYTLAHQADFVAAFMIMIRAWYAAGNPIPEGRSPLHGRYGAWANTMSGILAFAGVPGFLATMKDDIERTNSEDQQWEMFGLNLHDHYGDVPFTSNDLLGLFNTPNSNVNFPDVLVEGIDSAKSSQAQAVRIGKYLRTRQGQPFGNSGVRICKEGKDRLRFSLWRVTINPPKEGGDQNAAQPPVVPATMVCPICYQESNDSAIAPDHDGTVANCPHCTGAFSPVFGRNIYAQRHTKGV